MKNIKIYLLGVLLFVSTLFVVSCDDDDLSIDPRIDSGSSQSVNHNSIAVVDLGLPSGNLWTTMNVGAETSWDYGCYYAWGEIYPKRNYSWDTYKYGNDYNALTKYCTDESYGVDGFADNLIVLEASDDVATVKLGKDYSMPTNDDWTELFNSDYTNNIWTSDYNGTGVAGRIVYKKKSNGDYTFNDVHIFLPAAGCRRGVELSRESTRCYYWSSSLYVNSPYNARYPDFFAGYIEWIDDRYYGFSVRAVRHK